MIILCKRNHWLNIPATLQPIIVETKAKLPHHFHVSIPILGFLSSCHINPLPTLLLYITISEHVAYQPTAWWGWPCEVADWWLHWESGMLMHTAACTGEPVQGCTKSSSQTDRNSWHALNSWLPANTDTKLRVSDISTFHQVQSCSRQISCPYNVNNIYYTLKT